MQRSNASGLDPSRYLSILELEQYSWSAKPREKAIHGQGSAFAPYMYYPLHHLLHLLVVLMAEWLWHF